jgi:hypothetical protein
MMSLPITPDQFFAVLVQYNEAVWPWQVVLYAIALLCIGLLFSGLAWASRMISLLLAGLWLWMALAYHLAFFASINPAAWWFGILFLFGALLFDWFGVVNDRLQFHAAPGGWRIAGTVLLIIGLGIHPALSTLFGRHYPAAPTFGLPCPTTIFTIAMLLFLEAPAPRAIFVVPLTWSAIGTLAAIGLGIVEDLALLVAGIAGLIAVLFLHGPTNLTLRSYAPHPVRP